MKLMSDARTGKNMTHEIETTEDLRIRRTRKLLQEALIALTVEKGFEAVTVSDLTERAMVNRSTFYRHYLDKYDLLQQFMADVEEQTAYKGDLKTMTPSHLPSGLLNLIRHVQTYADFYRLMLGSQGDVAFNQMFRNISINHFRRVLVEGDTGAQETPIEMKLSYISCADMSAILWWLENNQPCSPEQLALWLGQLSSNTADLPLDHAEMLDVPPSTPQTATA
jgi:AcrR family transcriptional regulator